MSTVHASCPHWIGQAMLARKNVGSFTWAAELLHSESIQYPQTQHVLMNSLCMMIGAECSVPVSWISFTHFCEFTNYYNFVAMKIVR